MKSYSKKDQWKWALWERAFWHSHWWPCACLSCYLLKLSFLFAAVEEETNKATFKDSLNQPLPFCSLDSHKQWAALHQWSFLCWQDIVCTTAPSLYSYCICYWSFHEAWLVPPGVVFKISWPNTQSNNVWIGVNHEVLLPSFLPGFILVFKDAIELCHHLFQVSFWDG